MNPNCMPTRITNDPATHPPLNKEVLAWHEAGQNWHQVRWDGNAWTMRWTPAFKQFFRDYTHWIDMPLPPADARGTPITRHALGLP